MTTTDDGIGVTEKFQGDDVINIAWAIPTNQHTQEIAEYEAGVATYYKGANGRDSTLPKTTWTVQQTKTKVFNVELNRTEPSMIIPTQSGSTTKKVELGETDKDAETFWYWPQQFVQSSPTQIAFQLQRRSFSPNMVIKPGAIVRGKVGF